MNLWLCVASLLSLAICLLHVFAGGRVAAQPLLASEDLGFVAKQTNYYCWHLVTLAIAAIGLALGYVAWSPEAVELGWFAVGLAASFAVWSFVLGSMRGRAYLALPQWMLFLAVVVPGVIGMVKS
ncbi:MAG: hypothetical protein AAGJ70_03905 [Pseudomonadota bacterium]